MDNRSVMLLEIDNYLNELIGIIRIRNKSGNFDVNKVSENRAISLFNILYDLNLKNANNILSDNFPAVDLIDSEARVAIQVTSTTSKDKIIYTVEKFIEKKLYKDYDKLILYILTEKQKAFTAKTVKEIRSLTKGYIKFELKEDVIDNTDISKK